VGCWMLVASHCCPSALLCWAAVLVVARRSASAPSSSAALCVRSLDGRRMRSASWRSSSQQTDSAHAGRRRQGSAGVERPTLKSRGQQRACLSPMCAGRVYVRRISLLLSHSRPNADASFFLSCVLAFCCRGGGNNPTKRAWRFAKKRLGTHIRAKRKVSEMDRVIAEVRTYKGTRAAGCGWRSRSEWQNAHSSFCRCLMFAVSFSFTGQEAGVSGQGCRCCCQGDQGLSALSRTRGTATLVAMGVRRWGGVLFIVQSWPNSDTTSLSKIETFLRCATVLWCACDACFGNAQPW